MDVDRSELIRDNRKIHIRLEQAANRAIGQKGLTGVQAQLLLYILEHSEQGTSLTHIHQRFGYSMAALSGLVKRLREKNYVRAEPCARDDRKELLFGTEKGARVRAFLDGAILQAQDRLYGGFSQEELAALDRLQKKMLRNLSALTKHHSKEESQP